MVVVHETLSMTSNQSSSTRQASLDLFQKSLQLADSNILRNVLPKVYVNAVFKDGWTALLHACYYGSAEKVAILLKAGADAAFVSSPNMDTAFTAGAFSPKNSDSSCAECMGLLLQALGSHADDDDDDDDGRRAAVLVNTANKVTQTTALMAAASKKKVDSLKVLLAAGALVDTVDSRGRSALYHAVSARSIKACQVLVDAGASSQLKSKDGQSPLDRAEALGSPDLVDAVRSVRRGHHSEASTATNGSSNGHAGFAAGGRRHHDSQRSVAAPVAQRSLARRATSTDSKVAATPVITTAAKAGRSCTPLVSTTCDNADSTEASDTARICAGTAVVVVGEKTLETVASTGSNMAAEKGDDNSIDVEQTVNVAVAVGDKQKDAGRTVVPAQDELTASTTASTMTSQLTNAETKPNDSAETSAEEQVTENSNRVELLDSQGGATQTVGEHQAAQVLAATSCGQMDYLELVFHSLDLDHLTKRFIDHGITFEQLLHLTDEDLAKLGIESAKSRRRILDRCCLFLAREQQVTQQAVSVEQLSSSTTTTTTEATITERRRRLDHPLKQDDVVSMVMDMSSQITAMVRSAAFARQQLCRLPVLLLSTEKSGKAGSLNQLEQFTSDASKASTDLVEELQLLSGDIAKVLKCDQMTTVVDRPKKTMSWSSLLKTRRVLILSASLLAAALAGTCIVYKHRHLTYLRFLSNKLLKHSAS